MADNLTTFMCRLSRNLGASTSWNPLGLSRPVTRLVSMLCLDFSEVKDLVEFRVSNLMSP
jgi:hypothetical protein